MTTAASSLSSSIQSLLGTVNGTTTTDSSGTKKTDDAQTRFLTLLTTQLKNQDPLNPMDNAQMTSQLAQISTVDGIERLNQTLQKMLTGSTDSETTQAAALVGHTIMIEGNKLSLGSAGAVGGVSLKSPADDVVVTIKDANGLVVKTLHLDGGEAGTQNFTWDGSTDSGGTASTGSYTIAVKAKRGSTSVDATALQLANVASVMRTASGMTLNLGSAGSVTMDQVKQIF